MSIATEVLVREHEQKIVALEAEVRALRAEIQEIKDAPRGTKTLTLKGRAA